MSEFNSEVNEEIIDFLTTLNAKRIAKSGEELQILIREIAHRLFVQEPSYIKDTWNEVFSLHPIAVDINHIYETYAPTNKKVINMLQCDDSELSSNFEVYNYLKRFIKSLTPELLTTFLQFSTGSDVICYDNIKVVFYQSTITERRIMARTCGPIIELPSFYESYIVFKEEFHNQLICKSAWEFDIV